MALSVLPLHNVPLSTMESGKYVAPWQNNPMYHVVGYMMAPRSINFRISQLMFKLQLHSEEKGLVVLAQEVMTTKHIIL